MKKASTILMGSVVALLVASGCGSSGGAGDACSSNAECSAGAVCVNGRCEANSGAGGAGGTGGVGGAGGVGGDSISVGSGGAGGAMSYCAGKGPPILVGDGGGTVKDQCSGTVAQTTFRFALCSCTEYVSSNELMTDSFDSSKGPYTTGENGGSVGVNGRIDTNGAMSIGGALWVGSALGIQAGNAGTIMAASELHDQGPLRSGTSVKVGKDAWVGDEIKVGPLEIGGALTIPAGAPIMANPKVIGSVKNAPVTVDAPCACADSEIVDIAGYVSHYSKSNDNASIDLAPDAFTNYAGPKDLTLPCGIFYLSSIGGQGDLTLHIDGRTALFVGGNLTPGGNLSVELGPKGEIDMFVGGTITSSAPIHFGSAQAPARARLYVGGTGTIQLSAQSLLGGNLYAPKAELVTSGAAETTALPSVCTCIISSVARTSL